VTGQVLLAAPRGCCAGVDRAISTVEKALELYGAPVYVRGEIVHNRFVVESLKRRGAVFVAETTEVPEGAVVIFSAHGVAPAVREQAARRGLHAIDATCPLVTKIHREAVRFASSGYDILLIGQRGHEEIIGTQGHASTRIQLVEGLDDAANVTVADPGKVAWLSQTTLSVEETMVTAGRLRERFPLLVGPPSDDICYAAQNRQAAVRRIAADCDLVIVVGSPNSHNSARLAEVARGCGAATYLEAAAELASYGVGVTVVSPDWVLPVDPALLELAGGFETVVTVEDAARGAGGAIARACADARITATVRTLGLPAEFLGHGDRAALLAQAGLDAHGITRAVLDQTAAGAAARTATRGKRGCIEEPFAWLEVTMVLAALLQCRRIQ
jgi:4-hydroxy-3-methylbut-2-en-1-yl diphosphate reductase